jgi:translation elongation factor EF-Ts
MQKKEGKVVAESRNNDNDSILIALSCEKETTSKANLFNDLLYLIKELSFKNFPEDEGEVLSMEILSNNMPNEKFWRDCTFINDAVLKVSDYYKEEIILEKYFLQRVFSGRDWYKLFTYNHIDEKISSIMLIGSTNFYKEELKEEAYKAANLLVEHIALTNPLCIHLYTISPIILDNIRLRSIEDAKIRRVEEISAELSTQELKKFMNSYVLEEQTDKNGTKLSKIIHNNRLSCPGTFVRYQLK